MSPSHFFKLIYEEALKEKMLRLPKKFIRIHGETLSKEVIVELPCGSTWKMGLKKSVGNSGIVWLEKGWPKFANHYSLEKGHLLVFRYEGNSRFHVVICDITTCEIDYPPHPVWCSEPNTVVGGNRHCQRKETKEEDFQSNKRTKVSPGSRTPSNLVPPRSEATERNETKAFARKQIVSDGSDGKKEKAQVLKGMEKARALRTASGFKSNKHHFKIVMQPSYVTTNCLKIPAKFARKYLKEEACEVELKVGKRTWSLNYSFGWCTTRNQPTPRFNKGWRKFAEENNLDLGDICAFVLGEDSSTKASFKVTIFRANENTNSAMSTAHEDRRTPAAEADSVPGSGSPDEPHCPPKQPSECISTRRTCLKSEISRRLRRSLATAEKGVVLEKACFKLKCPSFRVVMQPAYINSTSYLPVPYEFAKKHIKKNQVCVALRLWDGRFWPAEYKINQPKGLLKTAGLYDGWTAFAVANKLEVGDVCIFELVNATEISLRVSIIRLADDANQELCKGSEAAASSKKLETSVTVKVETSNDD